jgi:hypothetical protein
MDGYVTIGTELDTKNFEAQIKRVEDRIDTLNQELELMKQDEGFNWSEDIIKTEAEIEKLTNQLLKLREQQTLLNSPDIKNVDKDVKETGKSMDNVIKKVGKWALAVFGIRSAYLGIRKAVDILSRYNDQIKTDLEYIGFAIAKSLEPLVESLIRLVYRLLGVVNSLINAWFGVNLLAKANTKEFEKANKGAKALKKSLAGFDEMNVLGNDSGTSSTAPSVDLSKVSEDGEKLKNFWKDIFDFWENDWQNWFLNVDGNWGTFFAGLGYTLKGFYDVFKGVFDLIKGIVIIFIGIFQGDTEKIKEGWEIMCRGLLSIITGIFELILGVILFVLGTIKGLFLDLVNGIYNIFIKPIGNFFVGLWNGFLEGAKTAWNGVKSVFSAVGSFFEGVFNTVKNIFKSIGQTIGNVISSAFKTAVNAVLSLADTIINSPIKAINSLISVINKVPGINLGKLNTITIPRLASGAIVNYPNKGVYSNGTIRGEAGREGVIPLTDSQAMAQLGYEIGRNVNITAIVQNYMDSRKIDRTIGKARVSDDLVRNA